MRLNMKNQNRKGAAWLLVTLMLLCWAVFAGQVSAGADKAKEFQFLSPENGDTVWGEVTVQVIVPNQNQGPSQVVNWKVDDGAWQRMAAMGYGFYSAKWNTVYYQDGWHNLTALYVDGGGGEQTVQIQVLVCQPLQPCERP